MAKKNLRRTNSHRRNQLRARVLREEDTCWLCHLPVDVTLPAGTPASPEVDEIIPVSLGGDPYARANTRLAHRLPMQPEARQQNAGQAGANDQAADVAELVTQHV